MDFVDATLPIVSFLKPIFKEEIKTIRPFKLDKTVKKPALQVKPVGKSTIQLLVRDDNDINALNVCTDVANYLQRNHAEIDGINVFDMKLTTPIYPDMDEETKIPEAWCYMSINYFES